MPGYRLVGVREGGPNEDLAKANSLQKVMIAMALHCEEWNNLIVYAPNGTLLAQLNHEGFVIHG